MTDQSQKSLDRNDPAIDPDPADNEPAQKPPTGQPDTQLEQTQESGGSTFTPDYEPEEKPADQRNLQPTKGQDADISTDGG
ncbi:hypothetical protein [Pseudomonas sp. DSP3-2-2]|jgi:hypothetical protein|uniref:hypothetical protein n=1 Tax=unclassified Pseudomonas TaxID=196821 RepID=UPI003CED7B4E